MEEVHGMRNPNNEDNKERNENNRGMDELT